MEILIYIGAIIYAILSGFMIRAKHKKAAIITWRLTAVVSILGLVLFILFECHVKYSFILIYLLLNSFVNMPLVSQASTCDACGRRVYWKPLISYNCPHCGEILYKERNIP